MKTRFRHCVSLLLGSQLALLPTFAVAYKTDTHRRISDVVFEQSVLGSAENNPLFEFGITDPSTTLPYTTATGDPTWSTPAHILAEGSVLEDEPLRFIRHFFDPQRGGVGFPTYDSSPDWVLEDRGAIDAQEFSLRDALGYHLQALTGATKAQRDAQLVILLETLGRSIHHLQDMSQPAHSRLDQHIPGIDGDIYEDYTRDWFTTHPIPSTPVYGAPVSLSEYLDTARAFWADDGAGIAEFAGFNFVSKDTNFRVTGGTFQPDPNHPLPVAIGASTVTLADLGVTWSTNPNAIVKFLHTLVQDRYSGASFVNDRASTYSIFSADLEQANFTSRLTLNRFNFEKNYDILLPRAVAYSTGLINYYFRGRLQLEDMQRQGGNVALTVKNTSDPFYVLNGNPQVNGADFRLFYDATDGERHEITLTGGDLTSELAVDETLDLTFPEPNDVDRAKEKPYLLVFNGMVGVEAGIAALAFGSGNSGVLVTPRYPTTDGNPGARVVSWIDGGWSANDGSMLVAGSIDWKGHNPVDVLSWGGGSLGRYFPTGGSEIYMSGRVLARAPGVSVLGASIRYVNNVRTLNVAIESGFGIAIYSRTFADSYSNDEMWSFENPYGWRLVYSGAHGSPFTGFFFNASGTEGQYITQDFNSGGPHRRVKVRLLGDSGSAEISPAVATVTRVTRGQSTDRSDPEVTSGTCTVTPAAPDGELEWEWVDGCSKRGLSGTRNIDSQVTESDQYTDRTLYCVDYKGDAEVFCELLPPSAEQVSMQTWITDIESSFVAFDTFGPTCGPSSSNFDVNRAEHSSSSSVRMMRIGNRSIPWVGHEGSRSWGNRYSGHSTNGSPSYTGNVTEIATGIAHASKLIYADARYDLVVYETSISSGNFSASGTYTEANGEGPYPWIIVDRNQTSVQVVMASSDGVFTMYQKDTTQNNDRTGTQNVGTLSDGFACAQQPRVSDDTTSGMPQRDPLAVRDIYSSMARHGSYAVDASGRVAASQLVIFEPANGGPPLEDPVYRHSLTGGSLPGLIPGSPPTEGYGYQLRLIR